MLYRSTLLLSSLCLLSSAFAGEPDPSKKSLIPATEETPWAFALAVPGWLAGVSGDVGVGGLISYADLSPQKVFRSYDMAFSLRGEASKGRLGLMGDILYISLSDGVGSKGVVNKVGMRLDETNGQLAVRWRLMESPRGWLDIYAGARYMSMYEAVTLQPDPEQIHAKSAELVDFVGHRASQGLKESGIREQIAAILRPQLPPLGGGRSTKSSLPVPPLHGALGDVLKDRIAAIIAEKKEDLIAAAQELKSAATSELKAKAQSRLDGIKKSLTKKVAREMESKIDQTASLNVWWVDPFVGLRGRYNLGQAWYLTARGDIGGFGIGSQLSWQAEGALGYQLSSNLFTEVGYRALGMDYQAHGFTNNTITHGAQITLGIEF